MRALLNRLVCWWRGHRYVFTGHDSIYGMLVKTYRCTRCGLNYWTNRKGRSWRSA